MEWRNRRFLLLGENFKSHFAPRNFPRKEYAPYAPVVNAAHFETRYNPTFKRNNKAYFIYVLFSRLQQLSRFIILIG